MTPDDDSGVPEEFGDLPPDLLRRILERAGDGAEEPTELADLRRWLESLPVIEQAKGILMARYLIDAETAFSVLRRWSSHHNIKIRTISRQLTVAASGGSAAGQDGEQALDHLLAVLEGPAIGPT